MGAIAEMIAQARAGANPRVVARTASGWAVMGEAQVRPGYCLLLADPLAGRLNDLRGAERSRFLEDMARLGDAVLAATGAARINYAVYGNAVPELHAHVFPRFDDEPAELLPAHPWAWDWDAAPRFSEAEHGALRDAIRRELVQEGADRDPGATAESGEPRGATGSALDASDRELGSVRDYPQPPEAVWAAWADPERLARWWGPAGFRSTFDEFDFRPGGRWIFTMHGPDGQDHPNRSEFVELDPPARLVLAHVNAPRFRLEATFAAQGGGTRLRIVQRFATAELRDRIARFAGDANEQVLDRLGDELARPTDLRGESRPCPS